MSFHCSHKRVVRLKGFTLVEVLVGMALTSLIVIIGMTVISHFSQLLLKIRQQYEQEQVMTTFYQILKRDVTKAQQVTWDQTLHCIDPTQCIDYRFLPNKVIRQRHEQADTFQFQYEQPVIFFHPDNEALVSRIVMNGISHADSLPLQIFKEYPLGTLLDDVIITPNDSLLTTTSN